MLKSKAKFFIFLWRITDISVNILSFIFAYYIRFNYIPLKHPKVPNLPDLWSNILILVFLWIVWSNFFHLYTSKRLSSVSADWKPVIYTTFSCILSYSALGFLLKTLETSRYLLAIYLITVVVLLGIIHQVVRYILNQLRSKGYNTRRLLIVGAGKVGRQLAERMEAHPEFGFFIAGFMDDTVKNVEINEIKYRIFGKINNIQELLHKESIDRVMIALPLSVPEKISYVSDVCEYEGVEVNIVPDLLKFVRPNTKVYDIDGIPVVGIRSTPVDSVQYIFFKRAFDIVFSLVGLVISLPIILLAGLAVKISSPGPMLFKQRRIGARGKEFNFYKIRTMKMQPPEISDKVWTTPNDGRRTRLGVFLRKSCIDELPQFWNVLKGDMSIVGPRPERPYFAKKFQEDVPKYMVRHQVKTGLTGWAQVNGYRGDTSIEKRIEYDLYYIENWSFLFDLKIIGLTIRSIFNGKNAY